MELVQDSAIFKFLNENGSKDIWFNIIIKQLSPIDTIILSFVCRLFKSNLKKMGELVVIFALKCRPCGSLVFALHNCFRFTKTCCLDKLVEYTKDKTPFIINKYSVTHMFLDFYRNKSIYYFMINEKISPNWGSGYNGITYSFSIMSDKTIYIDYWESGKGYKQANGIIHCEFQWKKYCPTDSELLLSAWTTISKNEKEE